MYIEHFIINKGLYFYMKIELAGDLVGKGN
jgi:hypothetical protein